MRKSAVVSNSTVEESLNILEKRSSCDADSYSKVVCSENGEIEVLFYQSGVMGKWYDSFPELLQIDGTYHLNDSNYVLYTFVIIDGNGDGNGISRIVAFLSRETDEHVQTCFEQFYESNVNSIQKTEVILLDKDFESDNNEGQEKQIMQ
uniref:MULE transposase domain-containing protein n=1 Tax=Romanomermis culicivorax TaxID=13658 RepID=A0A915KHA5_ROMCU